MMMDEKMKGGMTGGMMCKCPHHKVIPFLVLLFGLDFLFGNWGWLTMGFVDATWPILVTAVGAMMLMKGKCKCCTAR